MTTIDLKIFHTSSLWDNVWMDFKSMHSFFAEIMLSQILFFLGWAKLKLLVMGNSVQGLDFANWRKVFHAVILPILTYGLALWSDCPTKSLLNILQVAQNDAVRRISGTFRTTPTLPLHHMLAIPPIKYTVGKLRHQC